MEYFKSKYNVGAGKTVGHDYVLVGHSAGATLAFQSWMHRGPNATFSPAKAIVGLAGIYDLPLVVKNHSEVPFYRNMVAAAFGANERLWLKASPVNWDYEVQYDAGGLDVIVLAASEQDDLIEGEQWQAMKAILERQGWRVVGAEDEVNKGDGGQKELVVLPLQGGHDAMWEGGDELRRSIEVMIARLYPYTKPS